VIVAEVGEAIRAPAALSILARRNIGCWNI
jgi:hypothetical protein